MNCTSALDEVGKKLGCVCLRRSITEYEDYRTVTGGRSEEHNRAEWAWVIWRKAIQRNLWCSTRSAGQLWISSAEQAPAMAVSSLFINTLYGEGFLKPGVTHCEESKDTVDLRSNYLCSYIEMILRCRLFGCAKTSITFLCPWTRSVFTGAKLCNRTKLGVREMNWSLPICDELWAQRFRNDDTTYSTICINTSQMYSSRKRFDNIWRQVTSGIKQILINKSNIEYLVCPAVQYMYIQQ